MAEQAYLASSTPAALQLLRFQQREENSRKCCGEQVPPIDAGEEKLLAKACRQSSEGKETRMVSTERPMTYVRNDCKVSIVVKLGFHWPKMTAAKEGTRLAK